MSKDDRSGFSQQYISDLERGKSNPTVGTLYELAKSLGAGVMELAGRIEVPLVGLRYLFEANIGHRRSKRLSEMA